MIQRSFRNKDLCATNITIAVLSFILYTGHWLFWVDQDERTVYKQHPLTTLINLYFVISLVFALLLFVAGLGYRDNERWARWVGYVYGIGTLASLGTLYLAGNFLAADWPDWWDVFVGGSVYSGIYAGVLLALLLLKVA